MSGTSISIDPPTTQTVSAPARRTGSWVALLLPALTLFVAGMSVAVGLYLGGMTAVLRDNFLSHNTLAAGARGEALRWALIGGALVVATTALVARRRRAVDGIDAVLAFERASDLAAPATLACLVPALFGVTLSHGNPLLYLLVLATFGLTAAPLLRRSFVVAASSPAPSLLGAVRRRLGDLRRPSSRTLFLGLVVVASAAYAAFFAFYTIRNHQRIGTTAFDLGIYDNLMFNAIHGHPFRVPVLFPEGGNNLASHAEFGVIWFIPFYAIHPGPETMLIAQAAFLGFAAVPLYLFAQTLLSRPMAAVIAIAYLLFPPLHGPNFYDFHWLTLTPFFHFWLFYAIAQRRRWLTVTMMVMLYSLREDVAIDLAGLGLFLLLTRIRPRLGLVMVIVSSAWFAIDRFVIMPLAGTWFFQNHYSGLFADGVSSFGSVIKTILTNPLFFVTSIMSPRKLEYGLHMVAPLALLPLRRLSFVLLFLSGMFFTIVTTGAQPMSTISFQYTSHWTPFLFLATVLALVVMGRQAWGRQAQTAALCTLLITIVADSYCFGAVFQQETFVGGFSKIEFKMTPAEKRRYADLKELLALIPKDASVAATENETPHISTRKNAYCLRVAPPTPVDYLLISRSNVGDLSRGALNGAMVKENGYGLLAQRGDDLFLFKRGHVSPGTAAARAALSLPP